MIVDNYLKKRIISLNEEFYNFVSEDNNYSNLNEREAKYFIFVERYKEIIIILLERILKEARK